MTRRGKLMRIIAIIVAMSIFISIVPAWAFSDEGAPVPGFTNEEAPYTIMEYK
jgi:hypothetical protein